MNNENGMNPHEHIQNHAELNECCFLSTCYHCTPIFEETREFVAAKVAEIEKEVDNLSHELNDAYYIAIDQEIKQRTNYVRSEKFLLMFLRAESFNASMAALRMAHFFKWKLHLFGLETLPRPIRYKDLNEDDKKVLRCECFHFSGEDCEGRPILTIQLRPFIEAGLYHQRYMDNFNRIGFYVRMCILEGNEVYQKKGMVVVKWGFETSLSLKDYQLLISPIKLFKDAMPKKLVAVHDCRPNNLTNSWMAFVRSYMPKHIVDKVILHIKDSTAGCFSALSQYGIDVNFLPGNISGNVGEGIEQKLVQMELKQMLAMDNNGSCSSCPENISDDKKCSEFDILSKDLMEILGRNTAPNAICWSRGGTTITVHRDEFSTHFLHSKFGGIKFDSFMRKLHRCGFKRLSNKEGKHLNYLEYEHPQFQQHMLEQFLKKYDFQEKQQPMKGKFPVKLMNVLQNSALHHAIWWVCDGDAIAIEKNLFASEVLDKYFPGLKMESFYRMLRKWDFHRLSDKETCSNIVIFQNVVFKKNMSFLILSSLKLPSATAKPNFFEKLYNILGNETTKDAIWWLDSGDSFAINTTNFSRDVLSSEYNGIEFKSFRRSLKRWGFKQLGRNGNIVIYKQSKFQRDILRQSTQSARLL